jgi:hypothetical protein
MSSKDRIYCLTLSPNTSAKELERLAECALRLTPKVALRRTPSAFALFLDAPRSQNEQGVLKIPVSFSARTQVLAQKKLALTTGDGAWGVSASHAFCAALTGTSKSEELSLRHLGEFVDPFGLKQGDPDWSRALNRLIDRMKSLGVTKLGEFLALPASTLTSRFGADGVLIRQIAENPEHLLWPRFEPASEIEETQDLHDWGILDTLEPLLFILKPLFERLFLKLHARSLRLAEVKLTLSLPQGETREIALAFSMPQTSWTGVLPVVRDRLDFEWRHHPLDAEIRSLQLKVLHTTPGGGAQRDFFTKKEEHAEAWRSLFLRLVSRLGKGSAFVAKADARHLPESAWSASEPDEPPEWGENSEIETSASVLTVTNRMSVRTRRPTRLLRQPTPLLRHRDAQNDFLIDPKHRRRWRVFQWDEPEPLSGEWWKAASLTGFNRVYYRVETFEGEELWIYRQASHELFLHGYFD